MEHEVEQRSSARCKGFCLDAAVASMTLIQRDHSCSRDKCWPGSRIRDGAPVFVLFPLLFPVMSISSTSTNDLCKASGICVVKTSRISHITGSSSGDDDDDDEECEETICKRK